MDPEERRVEELLELVRTERIGDAEREELALYVAERPELRERIDTEALRGALGGAWLARVEADQRIARRETGRLVRAERVGGAALAIAGFGIGLVAPMVGFVAVTVGTATVLWSLARVRLATYRDDPYKEIER